MAVLRFPPDEHVTDGETEIRMKLGALGIDYERWDLSRVDADAPAEAVLAAYAEEIEAMKQRGGYVTADVIDVTPETPNLDAMLARFDKEHTHSEDEVRFILAGRGIFFLHLGGAGPDGTKPEATKLGTADSAEIVVSVEVGPGDMLRVPRGTTHWFTLCEERRIRAIRWFQKTNGWTPEYTGSGMDRDFQPLCFGPAYFGPRTTGSMLV